MSQKRIKFKKSKKGSDASSKRGNPNIEYWGSRIGIVLAVMGSAIGLGNFLRFPGIAARYGGGNFLIPYAIAFLLLGLPIAWAEWSLGRKGGLMGYHSSPGIFRILWKNKLAPYLGGLGLVVPVGIFMYYVFIEAWCLYYAWMYFSGGLILGQDPQAYESFFASFTGANANASLFSGGVSPALICVLICYCLNFVVIYRGINRGIELLSRYAIPALFVCSLLILLRVLTLGTPDPNYPDQNVLNALGTMWGTGNNPEKLGFWESLQNTEMWVAAAGHIFFSLSVGFGIIINYSSYLRKKDDVLLSATTAASGNVFAEIALGGMITIPAAFLFLGVAGISDSTFALGFQTLPNIFARMPLGQLIGFLWFFLLFLAALTSSVSMLQPALAFFKEGLRMTKKKALSLLVLLSLVGTGFILYFSKDAKALDTLDFWIGTVLIYILATFIVLLFAWVLNAKTSFAEAEEGSLIRIPPIFIFILKYISPVYLVGIFILWLQDNLSNYVQEVQKEPVVAYTFILIAALFIFFLTAIFLSRKKWKRSS